jgi:hypothetical protein
MEEVRPRDGSIKGIQNAMAKEKWKEVMAKHDGTNGIFI